jgi:hypothetical protein
MKSQTLNGVTLKQVGSEYILECSSDTFSVEHQKIRTFLRAMTELLYFNMKCEDVGKENYKVVFSKQNPNVSYNFYGSF